MHYIKEQMCLIPVFSLLCVNPDVFCVQMYQNKEKQERKAACQTKGNFWLWIRWIIYTDCSLDAHNIQEKIVFDLFFNVLIKMPDPIQNLPINIQSSQYLASITVTR